MLTLVPQGYWRPGALPTVWGHCSGMEEGVLTPCYLRKYWYSFHTRCHWKSNGCFKALLKTEGSKVMWSEMMCCRALFFIGIACISSLKPSVSLRGKFSHFRTGDEPAGYNLAWADHLLKQKSGEAYSLWSFTIQTVLSRVRSQHFELFIGFLPLRNMCLHASCPISSALLNYMWTSVELKWFRHEANSSRSSGPSALKVALAANQSCKCH